MKKIALLSLLVTLSMSAFAQFPLGSNVQKIKAYFGKNIPYASAQTFKSEKGDAICFTKVRVVGDYTFYFDCNGICTEYVVTYDRKDMKDIVSRFDGQFCKLQNTKWVSEEGSFAVTLVPPTTGENFFSIVYNPTLSTNYRENTLAAN
jgi:hypothetical protein